MDKPKPKFETHLDGIGNVFQENKSLNVPEIKDELILKAPLIDQYIFYVFIGNSKCGKTELIDSLMQKKTIVDFSPDFDLNDTVKFYTLDDSENVIYVDYDGFSFNCSDEDLENKVFKFVDGLPNNILKKYNEVFSKTLKFEKSNFLYVIMNDNLKLSLDIVILCNYFQRKMTLNFNNRNALFYLVYSKFDLIEDKSENLEAKKENISNETLKLLNHHCDSKSEIIFFVSTKPEEKYKEYNDYNRLNKCIQSSYSLMKNGLYQVDSDIIKIGVCGSIGSGKSSLIKEIGVVGDVPIGKDIIKTYDHKEFMNIKFYDNPDGLVSNPNNFSFVYQFNSVILVVKDEISDNYYRLIKAIDTFNKCNPEHPITLFIIKTYLDKEFDPDPVNKNDVEIENYKNKFKEQTKLNPDHKNNLYCLSLGDKYLKDEYLESFNKDLKKFIDEWFEKALSEKQTEHVKKFNSEMNLEKIKKIREEVSGFSTKLIEDLGVFSVTLVPFYGTKIERIGIKLFIKDLINRFHLNPNSAKFKSQLDAIKNNITDADILNKIALVEKKYSNINTAVEFVYDEAFENCLKNPDNGNMVKLMNMFEEEVKKGALNNNGFLYNWTVGLVNYNNIIATFKEVFIKFLHLSGSALKYCTLGIGVGLTAAHSAYMTYSYSLIREEVLKILENDAETFYLIQ